MFRAFALAFRILFCLGIISNIHVNGQGTTLKLLISRVCFYNLSHILRGPDFDICEQHVYISMYSSLLVPAYHKVHMTPPLFISENF